MYRLYALVYLLTCFFTTSGTPIDTLQIVTSLNKSSQYLNNNPDSCLIFANRALELSRKASLPQYLSRANQQLGRYFTSKEDFGKATQYFLEALKIEEQRKDIKRIADLNDELGIIYSYLENFKKALSYYTSALETFRKLNDSISIARTTSHLGNLHSSREYCETRTRLQKTIDYNTAIRYFETAQRLYEKLRNQSGIANCDQNLAAVYNKYDKPDKAFPYIQKAISYYRETNDWDGLAGSLYSLGRTYHRLKQYDKSIESYQESMDIAKKRNLTGGIQFLYEAMAQTYDDAHDYKNARDYYVKYMTLRDSIYNAEKSKQLFELETKYQSQKKENEILRLNLVKKKKDLFIYVLALLIIILSITSSYIIHRVRVGRIIAEQANKINKQKLKELEKNHQLLATQMVLQGEETERSRLARDLHDGLGGLLSGIKLTLANMKGNVIVSSENMELYNKALGLLDSSIIELRRVAHNMMPEALVKFGLKDALDDFCNGLNNHQINIKFQYFGTDTRYDSKIEISLYRIAQELINNAMKHAQASELIIQLIFDKKRLHLTVQDNGRGFNINVLKMSKGAGIANIKSRVESLNGRFELTSEPGKGTDVNVEFEF
ncbi:MAG TPA: sensor histidine kinase [Bacteroidales bacterium]